MFAQKPLILPLLALAEGWQQRPAFAVPSLTTSGARGSLCFCIRQSATFFFSFCKNQPEHVCSWKNKPLSSGCSPELFQEDINKAQL